MAHFPKIQERLLMLAETHLANHPAVFNRLRTDVEHDAYHTVLMAKSVWGMEYGYAVSTGLFAKVDARLLSAIDNWAHNQPELQTVRQPIAPVTPPSVGAAATTASEPAQGNAPPVDAGVAASDTPAQSVKKLPKWLIQNIHYIAKISHDNRCSSAQDLFNRLENLATDDNEIVQKGMRHNRNKLYFSNACAAISLVTFRKYMPEIKAHVLL